MKTRVPGSRVEVRKPAAEAVRRTVQRAEAMVPKSKPEDARLKELLRACVSRRRGSCQESAEAVYRALIPLTDGNGQNLAAQLITWAENAGTRDAEVHNHTAIAATWEGVTYVVDATPGQFGGPDFFIGSVAAWRAGVLGLASSSDRRVSGARFDDSREPFSAAQMQQIHRAHERLYPAAAIHPLHAATGSAAGNT